LGFEAGEVLHVPGGCDRCGGTGYRGRAGVFEIIEMTDSVRKLVDKSSDSSAVEDAALQAGMTTMLDDGISKCRAGLTSPAEVLRVVALR
jgi:general secretion pathway protein E